MPREVVERVVEFYEDRRGRFPFVEWLESLDMKTQARIRHRLTRVEEGNLGDCFPVGEGVLELRFFFGPGYRVYFGEAGKSLVLVILGGDKKSQGKNIQKAKEHWKNYQESLK